MVDIRRPIMHVYRMEALIGLQIDTYIIDVSVNVANAVFSIIKKVVHNYASIYPCALNI